MRKNRRSDYQQAYNAQAVVDAQGSQLILGARVSRCASDYKELVADVQEIDARVGVPTHVLADHGYANGKEVEALTDRGMEVLVSVGSESRRRCHDFRPEGKPPPAQVPSSPWLVAMAEKLALEENRKLYRLRQQTVEPVFGIIKRAMGFVEFSLRGEAKVAGEWQLMALAYNCKRLHNLMLS